jgi:hypothetical protein
VATSYTLKNLTKAVEQVESGGDPNAVSPKGARGRMQVLPTTAKDPGFGVAAARDSSEKEYTRVGKDYLKAMVKRYGPEAGLVAYNWGPGNAEKWIREGRDKSKLPNETRNYLIKVDNLASKPIRSGRKTTMASKSEILKRIQAAKKGKPTFQDERRLDTWKNAKQGSRAQEQGYNRALRNIQRSTQQGHSINKVDAEIVKSYVKETPEQLLSKSKTFMNLATWLPAGGAAAKLGATAIKAASKAAAPTTKAVVPKAAKVVVPKVAKAAAPKTVKVVPRGPAAAKVAAQTTKEAAKKSAKTTKSAIEKRMAKISKEAKQAIQTAKGKGSKKPSRVRKIAAEALETKASQPFLAHSGRRTGKAYRIPKGKPGAGQLHGLKAKDIKLAHGIRKGVKASPLILAGGLAGIEQAGKKDKKKKTVPSPKRKPARVTGIATPLPKKKKFDPDIAAAFPKKKKFDPDIAAAFPKKKKFDPDIAAALPKKKKFDPDIAAPLPKKKKKKDVREQYPTKGTRRKLKPLEGGVRYIETPFGRIKMDTSDKAFDYENPDNVTHGKKGGQVKKGVKKIKARKRAALRGHRAELRGG